MPSWSKKQAQSPWLHVGLKNINNYYIEYTKKNPNRQMCTYRYIFTQEKDTNKVNSLHKPVPNFINWLWIKVNYNNTFCHFISQLLISREKNPRHPSWSSYCFHFFWHVWLINNSSYLYVCVNSVLTLPADWELMQMILTC